MGTVDQDVVFPRGVKLTGDHSVRADEVHVAKRVGVAGNTRTSNLHARKAKATSVRSDEVATRTQAAGDSGKIRVEGTLRISGSADATRAGIAASFDAVERSQRNR